MPPLYQRLSSLRQSAFGADDANEPIAQPNPQPDPQPKPDPAPNPAPPPVPLGKLWTVIVEESGQITPAQGRIVTSKAVADWIEAKGHHKAWVIDKDALDEKAAV